MGTHEDPAWRDVTVGDVLAVLALARQHRDASAPGPASWDAVIAQVREVLATQVAGPHLRDAAPGATTPGSSTGHHQRTSHS